MVKDSNGELVQRFGAAKGEVAGSNERRVDFAGSGGIESRVGGVGSRARGDSSDRAAKSNRAGTNGSGVTRARRTEHAGGSGNHGRSGRDSAGADHACAPEAEKAAGKATGESGQMTCQEWEEAIALLVDGEVKPVFAPSAL